tara:strand:- start:31 stop:249 length:219 start_codon:yes stop_codon:yes gene_type:complete
LLVLRFTGPEGPETDLEDELICEVSASVEVFVISNSDCYVLLFCEASSNFLAFATLSKLSILFLKKILLNIS